jgi:hypothetical protein
VITNLDLIVTVDTAVGHLAGALGKPVWLMLPFAPDWRWLLQREDSPWYPSMRLFRQRQPSDWNSVITAVGASLGKGMVARMDAVEPQGSFKPDGQSNSPWRFGMMKPAG